MSCEWVIGDDCFVVKLVFIDVVELDDVLLLLYDCVEIYILIIKFYVIELWLLLFILD